MANEEKKDDPNEIMPMVEMTPGGRRSVIAIGAIFLLMMLCICPMTVEALF